ncbi:hypothetical protein V2J09_018003 [Rumex salicifolius]
MSLRPTCAQASESAMDTPEKASIGTPISKFEESPFSNFINSLSPINPTKTMNTSLTLGSLNFTSPPSVFTSPHVNLRRDSRFIRRHQLTDLAKLDLSSQNEKKDSITEDRRNAANCPRNSSNEVTGFQPSKDEDWSDPSCHVSDLIIELPMELKYGCSSPSQTEPGTSSCVPLLKEACRRESIGTQMGSFKTCKNVDGTGCNWDNFVSDAADFLAFESPQDPATINEPTKQSIEEQIDLIASLMSFPEDGANDPVEDQHDLSKEQVRQPAQATKLNQICHMQDNNASSSSGSFTGQTSKKIKNKPLIHHGVRRRCLVFEIQGARKNVDDGQVCTSSSFQEGDNILSNNKNSTIEQGVDSLISVRPGIGLHLNALAKGYSILKLENITSEKKPVPGSSESFPSPNIGSKSFKTSASLSSEDHGVVENKLLNAGNSSQASASGADDDIVPISPRKKRQTPP